MAGYGIDGMYAGLPAGTWGKRLAGAIGLIAGMVLFALVLLVAHSNAERDAAQVRQQRSYDILVLVRGLDSSLARAEAALGRFVISGDRRTGTLYYDAWRQAGRELNRLAQLTADNPRQIILVKALKQAYEVRGGELAAPATRAYYRQGWTALSLFEQAGRSAQIPRISRILGQIEKNELDRLDARSGSALARTDRSNLLSRLLSGMGLLIGVSALLLGWLALAAVQQRRAARRLAALEAERAARLEVAVSERTGELRAVNEKLRAEAETRAAAEAQLRQIQKMEAVGQLTGGIAHDFNNMLAVVVGALDLARRRLDREAGQLARHIDSAMDGANRAAALTQRLLAFSRAEPLLPESVSPGRLIADMASLLDRTLGERIMVVKSGLDGGWLVWVDPGQLETTILNLAVNARDAMDNEGTLSIAAEQITLAAGAVGGLPAGDYVCISVADTGCGMDARTRERAFEPFFTTKPVGKGTGLGLAQVFGFVRQSGGEVVIQSEPGRGSRIALYLPRYRGDVAVSSADGPDSEVMPVAALSVLVVEDDPRVRAATVAALEELGHQVVACGGGDDALALLAEKGGVDLIVSDVVMPGMTGPELVETALAQWPEIAILFVTGYAGEAALAENFRAHEILRKPFTISALSAAVAAASERRISGSPLRAGGVAAG